MAFLNTVGKALQKASKKTGINLPGNVSGKLASSGKNKSMTFSGATSKSIKLKGPAKSGQVKGATTARPVSKQVYGPPPPPKQTTSRSQSYSQPVGLQNLASDPGPMGDEGSLYEAAPTSDGFNVDAIINPVLSALDQTESEAQSLFTEQEGGIGAQKQTSLNRLAQTQKTQEGMLDTSATRQKQEGESAADEARRQFAEIQQGLQGRYGGSTGTGAFAAELAGRDTLGRIANIRQGVSTALQEIDDKKVQIQELGRIAAEDIDNEARDQISQAREQLNSILAGIRSQRGELASRKAELAMNAMQNFRALKAEVEARNASFKQNLYMRQQDAAARLAEAEGRARGIAEKFTVYNMSQGKQYSPVRVGNQGTIVDFNNRPVENPGALYGVGGALPDLGELNPDEEAF